MNRSNPAKLGRGVFVLCVAGCGHALPGQAAPSAPAPSPDRSADPAPAVAHTEDDCVHDVAAEREVTDALHQTLDRELAEMHDRVDVRFDCVPHRAQPELFAFEARGHGAPLRLLRARIEADQTVAIGAVLMVPRAPTLSSSPDVRFARVVLDRLEGGRAMAFVGAALAAHTSVQAVAETDPSHHEFAVTMSHDDEDIEFQPGGDPSLLPKSRAWAGHPGSLADANRMPLEVAWERLWPVVESRLANASPEDADRLAFARLWPPQPQRRPWVSEQLLQLAAVLGTADLVDGIGPQLDSPHADVRILAVNALAAITGDDRRRTASGVERPLDAVVADYRSRRAADAGVR